MEGSSTDPAVVNRIKSSFAGHQTLVTLDSDNSMAHVLNELRTYSPMGHGSYLVVEDTHIDGVPTQPGFRPGRWLRLCSFSKKAGTGIFNRIFRAKPL